MLCLDFGTASFEGENDHTTDTVAVKHCPQLNFGAVSSEGWRYPTTDTVVAICKHIIMYLFESFEEFGELFQKFPKKQNKTNINNTKSGIHPSQRIPDLFSPSATAAVFCGFSFTE